MLLTSSSYGYKLTISAADLVGFARQTENVCVPKLNRVEAACAAVKLVTKNEVDVLAQTELATVPELLGALDRCAPGHTEDSGDWYGAKSMLSLCAECATRLLGTFRGSADCGFVGPRTASEAEGGSRTSNTTPSHARARST